jgi:hypothetical protein
MTARTIFLLTAVSLGLAGSARCETPNAELNQKLADQIAADLKGSGLIVGARMKVTTLEGVVELMGDVSSQAQADAILQRVAGIEGVTKVESALKVSAVLPTAAAEPPMAAPPALAFGGHHGMMAQPLPSEPVPLASPSQPAYDQTGPKLPAHSWPTYSPYPNMSRVAYPQAYPYNAFPFIGPFYPFPKVPMGWRSVKLEWEDGHWYLGRLSTPHDYWRVRFW